jgi:metal-responsive CopG/Arc/MetJ family transcriptional regulator
MSRVIVTIPDQLLNTLDQEAKKEARTRSEVVREAIRSYIEQKKEEAEFRARQAEAFRHMDEARKKTAGSDFSGSDFIIKWRNRLAADE